MSRVAIFTACDRVYFPGAMAMLASARRHHPDVDRLCMVPPEDEAFARQTLGDLARVLTPPRRIAGVVDRLQIAHGKVFIADQTQYDTIVWVDGDILFCRPAPEIWDVRPGRVVAVRTPPTNRVPHNLPTELRPRFRERFPALSETPGFNGGLFAIRPADWPKLQSLLEQTLVELGFENNPKYFDQPLLNAMFDGHVDFLDSIFNWTEMFDTPPDPATVRLVHFASRPKPWEPNYPKQEPGYWFWVKHGLAENDERVLRKVKRRILLHTPRRRLAQLIRRWRAGGTG